jgi:hypothetical protein
MTLCNSISQRSGKSLATSSRKQSSPYDVQEPLLEEYSVAAHVGLSNPVHSPPHYADCADPSRARSARHSSFFGVSIHQMSVATDLQISTKLVSRASPKFRYSKRIRNGD